MYFYRYMYKNIIIVVLVLPPPRQGDSTFFKKAQHVFEKSCLGYPTVIPENAYNA